MHWDGIVAGAWIAFLGLLLLIFGRADEDSLTGKTIMVVVGLIALIAGGACVVSAITGAF